MAGDDFAAGNDRPWSLDARLVILSSIPIAEVVVNSLANRQVKDKFPEVKRQKSGDTARRLETRRVTKRL